MSLLRPRLLPHLADAVLPEVTVKEGLEPIVTRRGPALDNAITDGRAFAGR